MAVPIKALLGGVAVLGAGGTGIWLLYAESMPEFRLLVQDAGFGDSTNGSNVHQDYNGKYGQTYAKFLVGVGSAKSEATIKENESWGDGSFKNRYQTKTDNIEESKGFGSGISSGETLKAACADAYKGTFDSNSKKVTVSSTGSSPTSKEYAEEHIWLFCSYLEQKVVLLKESKEQSESTYQTSPSSGSKGGHEASVNSDLVSTDSAQNNAFGIKQQRDLLKIDASHQFFSSKKDLGLRETCKQAYATEKPNPETTSSSTSPSKKEILKYCSTDFTTN